MSVIPTDTAYFQVPLTTQFSNSFYSSLYEIYDLRKVFINEGLMDNSGVLLVNKANQPNSTIPYRN